MFPQYLSAAVLFSHRRKRTPASPWSTFPESILVRHRPIPDWPERVCATASWTSISAERTSREVLHDLGHCALAGLVKRAVAGQMNAILIRQRLIDRLLLKVPGDEQAGQVGDHQGNNDGIIPRHLKDHQDRGHGSAHDACKDRSHAHQSVGAGVAVYPGKKWWATVPTAPPSMAPRKRLGPKIPPALPEA